MKGCQVSCTRSSWSTSCAMSTLRWTFGELRFLDKAPSATYGLVGQYCSGQRSSVICSGGFHGSVLSQICMCNAVSALQHNPTWSGHPCSPYIRFAFGTDGQRAVLWCTQQALYNHHCTTFVPYSVQNNYVFTHGSSSKNAVLQGSQLRSVHSCFRHSH